MESIDINIPVDRRTAIAAGAVLVAAAGGLAYCALRPSVKVVCAESIASAMRAVGDKYSSVVSIIPVADADCTADKVSSLASSRGADVIIWKNNAPFEDLDGSGLGNLQSLASELSAGLTYAVNTEAEVKSLAVCGDAPVVAFGEELAKQMGGELPGDILQLTSLCQDLREDYPSGVIGIEDSEADSWGLAACLDYLSAYYLGSDLLTLPVRNEEAGNEDTGEGDAGDGNTSEENPYRITPLYMLHFMPYVIGINNQASQSASALESGLREAAYPIAIMRCSSFVSLKTSGTSCDAVRPWGLYEAVPPIMYPAYSVSVPETASTASQDFIRWLLQSEAQGILSKGTNYIPTARGVNVSEALTSVYGGLLDTGEGGGPIEQPADEVSDGSAQSTENDTPADSDTEGSGGDGESSSLPVTYALPSWMSTISATSRERYMADARRAIDIGVNFADE